MRYLLCWIRIHRWGPWRRVRAKNPHVEAIVGDGETAIAIRCCKTCGEVGIDFFPDEPKSDKRMRAWRRKVRKYLR